MLENQGKVGMVLNVVPVQSTRVILMMKATAWDGAYTPTMGWADGKGSH